MVRLKEGRDKVHPGMAALLHELKPHYRLGLLSNTDLVEMETPGSFRNYGLDNRDFVFLNQHGSAKKIIVNPAEGRVSLEFHLANTYSSYQSGSNMVITNNYCPLLFSLKK
jgi:hypothetical protein